MKQGCQNESWNIRFAYVIAVNCYRIRSCSESILLRGGLDCFMRMLSLIMRSMSDVAVAMILKFSRSILHVLLIVCSLIALNGGFERLIPVRYDCPRCSLILVDKCLDVFPI